MQSTREGLLELPKAPSNDPSNEIATSIHGFVRDLARHVQGVPTENGLLQNIISQQEHFRRAVRGTAPDFCPFEKHDAGKRTIRLDFLVPKEGTFVEDSYPDREGSNAKKRIYVDEVLERAQRCVRFQSSAIVSRETLSIICF